MRHDDNPFASFEAYFQLELIDAAADIAEARRRHEADEALGGDLEQLRQLFRLRHSVYCDEFRYEEPQPDGLEMDGYDDRAWHAVLRYRGTSADKPQLAGCVRLVYAEPWRAAPELPFQAHYRLPLFAGAPAPGQFKPGQVCEISRLAVHQDFRRRSKEGEAKEGAIAMPEAEQARTFPMLADALFAAATVLFVHKRKDHVFVMMEPRLHRRLHRREGIRFQQIGALTEFRGRRAPFYLKAGEGEHDLRQSPNLAPLYEIVRRQLGLSG